MQALCKKPSNRSWRTDRQRATGIRMHAGNWGVQLVHSMSARAREGPVWAEAKKGGKGGQPEKTLWQKLEHRKSTRNELRGNRIKKGGCQSGLSWLPHPVLCAKFQERLSPCSRVGGD